MNGGFSVQSQERKMDEILKIMTAAAAAFAARVANDFYDEDD
jgi:hypothetical protein